MENLRIYWNLKYEELKIHPELMAVVIPGNPQRGWGSLMDPAYCGKGGGGAGKWELGQMTLHLPPPPPPQLWANS